jgi:hypothetical protein
VLESNQQFAPTTGFWYRRRKKTCKWTWCYTSTAAIDGWETTAREILFPWGEYTFLNKLRLCILFCQVWLYKKVEARLSLCRLIIERPPLALHTRVHFSDFYGSENKQQLLLNVALTWVVFIIEMNCHCIVQTKSSSAVQVNPFLQKG